MNSAELCGKRRTSLPVVGVGFDVPEPGGLRAIAPLAGSCRLESQRASSTALGAT